MVVNFWLKLQNQKQFSAYLPNFTFVYSVGYVIDASHQLDNAPSQIRFEFKKTQLCECIATY